LLLIFVASRVLLDVLKLGEYGRQLGHQRRERLVDGALMKT
jgi:hypothetical protein